MILFQLAILFASCTSFVNTICSGGTFWNPLNNACVDQCPWNSPTLYYADPSTSSCVTICPTTPSYYANDLTQKCVQTCPWDNADATNQTYYDNFYRRCTLGCPSNPSFYAHRTTKTCVQYCPVGTFSLDSNRTCVSSCPNLHFVNSTLDIIQYQCVATCPNNTFRNSTNYCILSTLCPNGFYGDPVNGICTNNCPGTVSVQMFADTNPNIKMCVYVCPKGFYIQNITANRTCVSQCLPNSYINYITKMCVTNCSTGTFALTGQCLPSCPSPFFASNSSTVSGTCVLNCTGGKFRDQTTRTCVTRCPPGYFGDVTGNGVNTLLCVKQCMTLTEFGNPLTLLCVNKSSCGAPFSYADNHTRQCVTRCPDSRNTFGKISSNQCVDSCPPDMFKDFSTQLCVTGCPQNPSLFADSTTSKCVSFCPNTYYAVESSRTCELSCPNNFYKNNDTRTCVSNCPIDPIKTFYYATNSTSSECVAICPGVTKADPKTMSCITSLCPTSPALFAFNNTCISQCPADTYAQPDLRQCKTSCTGLYYKDISTKRCVLVCPTNPSLYANTLTNTCVAQCDTDYYSDNSTRKCVTTCNQSVGYIAYKPQKKCVLVCLNNTFSHLGKCIQTCPNTSAPFYYKDTTTLSCVSTCPDYYFKDDLLGLCVTLGGCSTGYYADYSSRKCVLDCNSTLFIYKQADTLQCVDQCPFGMFGDYSNPNVKFCATGCSQAGWYADNSTWTCVQQCPQFPSYYADEASKSCVSQCRPDLGLYAYDGTRQCIDSCPNDTFADNYTRRCLIKCLMQPSTYQFTDPDNQNFTSCVLECPIGYFADNKTRSCVLDCPSNPNYFAQWQSRTCVSVCPQTATTKYYANNFTRTCVDDCLSTDNVTYRDPILRLCMPICSGLQYADPSTGDCVPICPWDPDYYGQLQTKTCVPMCDPLTYTYAQNQTRQCLKVCPTGTFADNSSQRCVSMCSIEDQYYGDPSTHTCVLQCPDTPNLFADNSTQQCVSICPNQTFGTPDTRVCAEAQYCTLGYFGDPYSKLCVLDCPPTQGTYADNLTNLCVQICPNGSYADNSSYRCVQVCPDVPSYFGYQQKCLQSCPQNWFADTPSRLCVQSINCSGNTYGDPSSQKCVATCPFNYYKDTRMQVKMCVKMCEDGLYADDSTKSCVPKCPLLNKTYGNNQTNKCVQVCPPGQFAQNDTRMCLDYCPNNSYADSNVRVCVQVCSATPNLYGNPYTQQCVLTCPSEPDLYAQNSTRMCMPQCPFSESTFADRLTRRCVHTCPVSAFTYADNITRACQEVCTFNGSYKSYADNSTLRCVQKCPDKPDYYADQSTKTCVPFCPNNTVPMKYSDNSTRVCQPVCNQSLYFFADNTLGQCLIVCPGGYFADDLSNMCVPRCPGPPQYNQSQVDTFGFQGDRTCKDECNLNWLAQNSTRLCVQNCPNHQYADTNKRRCVSQCDGQQRQYADNTTNTCRRQCPQIPDMFADNLTYKCVYECPPDYWASNITRQCVQECTDEPLYYADNHTGRCVQKCPINLMTYADNLTKACVLNCPDQILDEFNETVWPRTFADDSTKTCVTVCPQEPWTYAQNSTLSCVFECPNNTFGENQTRQCVQDCTWKGTFADNATTFCVQNCSQNSFADPISMRCVQKCPPGSYADNSTWSCVKKCPINPAMYADLKNYVCVINCPNNTFGDDLSRTCVKDCPTSPVYFAYNVTNRCLKDCIFPFFGQVDLAKCVLSCYWGQYRNMSTHRCEKCPTQCTSCVSELGCQTCINNFYLYNGTCLTGCQTATNPCISACPVNYLTGMITYASNMSQSCVESCPANFYGLNSTLFCVRVCPINFYHSESTRRCELCINGCNNCTNTTYCFGCYPGYLFSNNLCIKQCSSTLSYYYGGTCISGCIEGTYLMSDKVTCNNCSAKCSTCSLIATNCTKCVGAYLYNYNCVSKCPDNYFANSDLSCVQCTSNSSQCNVAPLTYTLTTVTQNGQLYGVLTFNRAVSMDMAQIKSIISINLNGIPSSQYSWSAVQMNSTTYRINIFTLVSLNQISLQLTFLLPDLVLDSLGTVLETTTYVAPLPSYDYISPDVIASSKQISNFGGIMSWIALILLLILLFKGAYPLLLVTEVFQHIYFHYFVIEDLPYNYSNFLINLKSLNFQFLPNILNLVVPSQYVSPATPIKFASAIKDTTFFVSCGHYITLIIIYVLWAVVIALLKNKAINKFVTVRRYAKEVFLRRIRFNAVNQCLWFCFMSFVIFGLWQFKNLDISQSWLIGNDVVAIVCLCVSFLLVFWNIYLSLSYKKSMDQVPKKYQFILGDDSFIPYQMPLRYIRKLLFCIFIFMALIQLQIIALIAVNFMMLVFYLYFRPSKSKFNNYINILIQLAYIGLEVVFLMYYNTIGLQTDQKLVYGTAMIAFSCIALITVIVWMVWQFMLFMYDFKFVRDIIEQTKLANQIHPDQDNLKLDFQKEYENHEIVSQEQLISSQDLNENNRVEEDTVQGIQKQYDQILHYDDKKLEQGQYSKPQKQNNQNKKGNDLQMLSQSSGLQGNRLVSSRGSSRLLFGDLNIEDFQ